MREKVSLRANGHAHRSNCPFVSTVWFPHNLRRVKAPRYFDPERLVGWL